MTGRQFRVDRGGTFTDTVARRPDARLLTHELLSDSPARYDDAAVEGVLTLLAGSDDPVRMGTTVATNALPEREGERTLLVIARGLRDALRIAYRNRPSSFARRIELPEADGAVTELGGSDSADVASGDVLVIETPGGGSYGPPSPDPHQAGEEIDDLRAF